MKSDLHLDEISQLVAHMLMTFGPLSYVSLEDFTYRLCEREGWPCPDNLFRDKVLPHILKSRLASEMKGEKLANRIPTSKGQYGQDAFWLFLEHCSDADFETVMEGPYPAQVTYMRNGNIYHIIRCKGCGGTEIGLVAENELAFTRMKRGYPSRSPSEKFLLLFSNMDDLMASANIIHGPTIKGTISYNNSCEPPRFFFP